MQREGCIISYFETFSPKHMACLKGNFNIHTFFYVINIFSSDLQNKERTLREDDDFSWPIYSCYVGGLVSNEQ